MNSSISIANLSYEHQQVIEAMKSQLLIEFVRRLGGKVVMPVDEVDTTGKFVLSFKIDVEKRIFTFIVQEKEK